MPVVEVKETIPAPIASVFEVVSDMESYPKFMKTIKAIRILERGDGYTVSDWEARLQGARFHWVEKDLFDPEHYRITYDQTSGDLRVFRGYWQLEEVSDGTQVTLVTEFEFGVPMLSSLLNPVAKVAIKDNAKSMLDGIARQIRGR